MKPMLTMSGKELHFIPPRNPTNEVKEELGGKWDKGRGVWRLPPTSLSVVTLVEWYGRNILDDASWDVKNLCMHDWGFQGWSPTTERGKQLMERAEAHPRWDDLYDFQKDAVEWMTTNPHNGGLLGLDPGLGKGPVSIVTMDILQASRVLIVAPLTLARNWMAELDKWQRFYRSWSRATKSEKDPRTESVITNHEVLFEPHWYDEEGYEVEIEKGFALAYDYEKDKPHEFRATPVNMKQWITDGPTVVDKRTGNDIPARKRIVEVRKSYDKDWNIIIVDESVLLKNRKALKVDMIYQLAKYAGWIFLLSGSPTTKFNNDLYPQMKVIQPRAFRSYWRFTEYFCVVDKGQWGWKITGNKPDKPPQRYLRDFIFMRSQKDVLPELPDYIYDPIEVDLNANQQRAFDEMMEEWRTMLDSGEEITASIKLAQQTRAAQITSNLVNIGGERSSAKEDLLMTLIDNDDIQFPLLVWTWWVPTAESVFKRIAYDTKLAVDFVIGDMDSAIKDVTLDDYKAGELDVLVLQMGVGRFGHTLTDTRTVFYHDRHFDSDAYFQSLRRVRRIGLDHRPRLIVPRSLRSFDPIVEMNLAGKLQSIAELGNKDLRELLEPLGYGGIPWTMKYEQ